MTLQPQHCQDHLIQTCSLRNNYLAHRINKYLVHNLPPHPTLSPSNIIWRHLPRTTYSKQLPKPNRGKNVLSALQQVTHLFKALRKQNTNQNKLLLPLFTERHKGTEGSWLPVRKPVSNAISHLPSPGVTGKKDPFHKRQTWKNLSAHHPIPSGAKALL